MFYSIAALALASCVGGQAYNSTTCKPVFGSSEWPSTTAWDRLNNTVPGRLIAPDLPGAVCHADHAQYNNGSCTLLAAQWTNASFHAIDPVSVDYNDVTCLPDSEHPCTPAGYPRYVVQAANAHDIPQGGAGSFAVLVSVTVKVYPALSYSFVTYSYNTTSDSEAFRSLTAYWASVLPQLSEAELMGYHYPVPNDPSEKNASMGRKLHGYWFGPELSMPELEAVLAPVNEHIRTAQWGAPIVASNTTISGDNLSALLATGLGDDNGGIPILPGSRLLDGKALSKPLDEIKKALRKAHGLSRVLQIFNVAGKGAREPLGGIPGGSTALLPAWPSAYAHVVILSSWEALNATAEEQVKTSLREDSVPALESLAPGAGAYISESDPTEKRWKEVYYGANYDTLLGIKDQWDPKGVFWNKNGVGSDLWEPVGSWGLENGVGQNPVQLCRVAS